MAKNKNIDLKTWTKKISDKEREITQTETKLDIAKKEITGVVEKIKSHDLTAKSLDSKIAELIKSRDKKIKKITPLLEELEGLDEEDEDED